MNEDEYLSYASEIKFLEELLTEIPVENVIDRISFESRLADAKAAIAHVTKPQCIHKVHLTFRGEPVFGSHGMIADFGCKAAGTFSEAITAIAAGFSDQLQDKGPIPDKHKNQLIITGTAIGSFGFEFALPSPEDESVSSGSISLGKALNLVQDLFQRATEEGSDDEMTELIDEIHPRARKKTAEFLNCVAQHGAWCSLDFKNRSFRFQNLQQLIAASKRLQETNIQERSEMYIGTFQGILPSSRIFEFKPVNQSAIIKGKIAYGIEDPDTLNHNYLNKQVEVELKMTQVGVGKPRYSLSSLNKIRLKTVRH